VTPRPTLRQRLFRLIVGKERDIYDRKIFHKLSLIAFFAWVGLGADGITSSCYGPQEAFLVLGRHHALAIVVALFTALTIFVISASYMQIIELFPSGGGGYMVASRLLSPGLGMLAGSALIIDYVLTIAVSISSGSDALFSFLPPAWYPFKLWIACLGVVLLILMNLRGVRESVLPLVPIFIAFLMTHLAAIGYAFFTHALKFGEVARSVSADIGATEAEYGLAGMALLILRSYSMGAGTFTGIEAVSNGMPILREPRVKTAKRTMVYMSVSLAVMAVGLMVAYFLYRVEWQPTKTLNAVLFETMTAGWGSWGRIFVLVTLFSEAVLLFVAAQTGFLGGPRILSNMATDRWVPSRFSTLSDRLVTQNGILIMGGASIALIALTRGSVRILVVLYAINVFITFSLSQLGMVRHWWQVRSREKGWMRKLLINGVGLAMTLFILTAMVLLKFREGGWVTLGVTGALAAFFVKVRGHYGRVARMLKRLDALVPVTEPSVPLAENGEGPGRRSVRRHPKGKTAVIFVNGFNGLGLHTLFSVLKGFPGMFKNFVFVQVGVVDAVNFLGTEEIRTLEKGLETEAERYVRYMKRHGYFAETATAIGVDVVDEIVSLAVRLQKKNPSVVYFGGQLVFSKDSFVYRWLHNYTIFAVQRKLHFEAIPVVIMPIRVY
jgi:amino acid transporter